MKLPPFSSLLENHQEALYRFLILSLGEHDADDCFQETVLAALSAYPKLGDARNLKGWLFTIAYRKSIDSHRGNKRVSVGLDGAPEPAAAAIVAAIDPVLHKAINALSERRRSALQLRFWADLSYADLSRTLGCSPAAARRRVADAVADLKKKVKR